MDGVVAVVRVGDIGVLGFFAGKKNGLFVVVISFMYERKGNRSLIEQNQSEEEWIEGELAFLFLSIHSGERRTHSFCHSP